MGVQVPCRFHAEVPQEAAVWTDQAAPGTVFHAYPDIDPAEVLAEVIGYLKKSSIWIAQNVERKLRNFLGHKFWARGYFVFDRRAGRAGRGDDPRLHQKAGDGGQAIGSIATEARHLMTSQLSSQNPL